MLQTTESRFRDSREVTAGMFVFMAIICAIFLGVVALVKWIWPSTIPFGLFDVWVMKGSLIGAIASCWPAFVWGAGATLILCWWGIRRGTIDRDRYDMSFGQCIAISLFAGVFEEIIYRWLLFCVAVATLPLWNGLFFDWWWFHFGLPEWIFSILGPVANFFTLGKLAPYLLGSMGWVIGMAVLSANADFRNGHKYLGWIGYVNSWFMGMLFFFLMFQYGIVAAIAVHFLYDLVVFTLASIMVGAAPRPRSSWNYGYRY